MQNDSTQENYSGSMTYEEIMKTDIEMKYPIPDSINCKFCNKELKPSALVSNHRIFIWNYPKWCDCKESIECKDKEEKERKTAIEKEIEEDRIYRLNKKIEIVFKQSKLGERFKTRTFETFKINDSNKKPYRAALKYAENFEEYKKQGIGVMFNGGFGTGKTHLAAAIALYLLNKGIPVIFGTLINLLGKIKETYSDYNESEEKIIDTYCMVDLLVIDDLGKEKPTEWVLEKLYNIVNTRYENNKPIIITTNYNYDELVKRLTVNGNDSTASALASRLNEICRGVLIEGQDYRMM